MGYDETYEINLQQITQVLGINIKKKQFIFTSLHKFFSGEKYSSYEAYMQDNIRLEGQKVGRKYFLSYSIQTREDLIKEIRLSKTSMMMQYLLTSYTGFDCRVEQEAITEHLEKLYLYINKEIKNFTDNIEIGYDVKKMLEIISDSTIYSTDGMEIEQLTNYQLLETYLDLLLQLQMKEPKKVMIILENMDHLLDYLEYEQIYLKMREITEKFDCWFLISTSLHGYVIVDTENIEGIQIVNDDLFCLPSYEHIYAFLKKEYPVEYEWNEAEVIRGLKEIMQYIGKKDWSIYLKGNVFLKLINQSLGMNLEIQSIVNSLEMAFLQDDNVI